MYTEVRWNGYEQESMGLTRFLTRQFGPMENFMPSKGRPMALRPDIVLVQGYFTTPASIQHLTSFFQNRGYACAVPSLGGLRGQWQTDRVPQRRCVGGLPGSAAEWDETVAHRPFPWRYSSSLCRSTWRGCVADSRCTHVGLTPCGVPSGVSRSTTWFWSHWPCGSRPSADIQVNENAE